MMTNDSKAHRLFFWYIFTMTILLVLSAILISPATAQTQPASSKIEKPESPEHKYARERFEEADRRIKELSTLMNQGKVSIAYVDRTSPKLLNEMGVWEKRMHGADTCKATYDATVDRKISDLTVRESTNVDFCKSIGSYPPESPK